MTCTPTCVQPSPNQAHCGACHVTFGGVSGFDRHRRDGQCLTPETIGYTDNGRGVYRAPMSEAGKARLASLRTPQTAEGGSGVGRDRADGSEVAETISGPCDFCGHPAPPDDGRCCDMQETYPGSGIYE